MLWVIKDEIINQLGMGIVIGAIIPVVVLQYFWLWKIIKRVIRKSKKSNKDKSNTDKTK
jgi:hypothetical protein